MKPIQVSGDASVDPDGARGDQATSPSGGVSVPPNDEMDGALMDQDQAVPPAHVRLGPVRMPRRRTRKMVGA